MRLSDIPQLPNVIDHFVERFRQEDAEYMALKARDRAAGKVKQFGNKLVGFTRYREADNPDEVAVPIILDEGYHQIDNAFNITRVPLAAMVRTTKDERCIVINERTRTMALKEETFYIIQALMAHEIGHLVLGHLDREPVPENEVPTECVDFRQSVMARLTDQPIDPDEFAANCYAVGLTDLGSVLGLLTYHASYSYHLATRMWFQNQIRQLLEVAESNPDRFTVTVELSDTSFYTDEQIAEIMATPDP